VPLSDRAAVPPELVTPARVERLVRYALCEWVIIVAVAIITAHAAWWLYPLGAILIAGRLHALGVVLHDACHMGRRASASHRALLDLLAGYPIATHVDAMRFHHLRHHRASGMPQDPYFKPGVSHDRLRRNVARLRGLIVVPAWIVRGFYGSAALFAPRLRESYGRVLMQDRSGRALQRNPELLQCLRQEPKQALFFCAVGVAAWHYPHAIVAYYLVPLVVAGALNVNRVIVEHIHVPCADRRTSTVAATTVTHDWGALGKLVLFPRNIGFHTVHHLHPQAALEALPALQRYYAALTPISESARPAASGKKSSS
jgi:fatty acid desaturase